MKVIWTAFAGEQLEDVYQFIQSDNNIAAVNIYNDILDAGEMSAIQGKKIITCK
ncbi:hypothetical protein FACS189446_3090 [Bacteroidia bacterium]|nr:hypothetical protein FACS189446_3090 [Bacteroidia bacterium]